MSTDYSRIPLEMRGYAQWVVWRFEDRNAKKPTKVPYDPRNGRMASVVNPNNWCTFEQAVGAIEALGPVYDGIGFVLTKNDPYTFVDLDDTTNAEDKKRHLDIYTELNSYTETSPSGRGLHVIVKAQIPQGRRRSSVELYDTERYMTMTGDVVNDKPILDTQELVTHIWSLMGNGAGAACYSIESQPQTETDEQVTMRALNAENGPKFCALLEGHWEGLYTSQSEADFAFIDIIAFYTENVDQILRLFWGCPLGQRDKATRKDYVMGMVHRAFDRKLPPIDFTQRQDKITAAVAAGKIKTEPTCDIDKRDATLKALRDMQSGKHEQFPPGLLGEISEFILAAAPRPVPVIALAGGIGLMSGMCGRAYNISGTGLNTYVCLLAPTGVGKEAINRGVSKLMGAVTKEQSDDKNVPAATNFIGPADFASGQALLRTLSDPNQRCFVSFLGEFGLTMQRLSHPKASSNDVMLKKVLLDLYNKSGEGDILGKSAYAQKEKNTDIIESPSVSILGESTPGAFYKAVDEELILDGLLPRFTFMEYTGPRPSLSKTYTTAKPPPELINKLCVLAANNAGLHHKGVVVKVGMTDEAVAFFDKIEELTTALINQTENDALRDLWNRVHLKALKFAAAAAVGLDFYNPIIDVERCAQWAYDVVVQDVFNLTAKFSRGEVGRNTEEMQQGRMVLRMCKDFVTHKYREIDKYKVSEKMYKDKVMPGAYVTRRLTVRTLFSNDRLGAAGAINRAIKSLCDAGDLQEVGKGKLLTLYDFGGRAFMLANPDKLPDDL